MLIHRTPYKCTHSELCSKHKGKITQNIFYTLDSSNLPPFALIIYSAFCTHDIL